MSNKYKLVALDMDGTSYHKMGTIIEENIAPIIRAQEIGVKVVFVTGRPVNATKNRFVENGFTKHESIAIGYNGALIFDFFENKEVAESPIPKDKMTYAFALTKKYGELENVIWAYSKDEDLVYLNKKIEGTNLEPELSFYDGKFNRCYETKTESISACYKMLITKCNPDFLNELSQNGFEVAYSAEDDMAEVNHQGINKKYAIEFLCKKYNIHKSEVLAMGDGRNDLSMLEFAGFSVAPSNACDAAKASAKEVSPYSSVDGAVAKTIIKYILEGE